MLKCPRCREGNLFPTKTFSFKKPFDMPEHCPHCQQPYELEPGFYYGAMFISYIFTGFGCLAVWSVFHFIFRLDWMNAWLAMVGVVAVLFVYIFRLARSIWIHLNVKHDPACATHKH